MLLLTRNGQPIGKHVKRCHNNYNSQKQHDNITDTISVLLYGSKFLWDNIFVNFGNKSVNMYNSLYDGIINVISINAHV